MGGMENVSIGRCVVDRSSGRSCACRCVFKGPTRRSARTDRNERNAPDGAFKKNIFSTSIPRLNIEVCHFRQQK